MSYVKNRISRLLFERGWIDGELAGRTGISRERINRIKNRRARPTVGEALLISGALHVSVTDIFFLPEDMLA